MALSIDEALRVLKAAKAKIGGDKALILSLTDSGLPDANVEELALVDVAESQYVEVRVKHHYLETRPDRPEA